MRTHLTALALAAALGCVAHAQSGTAAPGTAAATPPLRVLLDRAAAYVHEFVVSFSNVVAEEDFRQEWLNGERRRLTSEFLLVRYPGASSVWLAFRDVVAVNGQAVRDQQQRVTRLFLEPFDDAVRRAEEITREASRHSLAELGPLSSPLAVVAWLQAGYQSDFTFKAGGRDVVNGVAVRRLDLEQIVAPSANPAAARIVPVRGVAWIDEASGRVVKTEARSGLAPNTTIITTTFRFDEGLGIDVPSEMRDSRVRPIAGRAVLSGGRDSFTGVATYRRFRRFQVRTDEAIDDPK